MINRDLVPVQPPIHTAIMKNDNHPNTLVLVASTSEEELDACIEEITDKRFDFIEFSLMVLLQPPHVTINYLEETLGLDEEEAELFIRKFI